jgi:hypothetical protein
MAHEELFIKLYDWQRHGLTGCFWRIPMHIQACGSDHRPRRVRRLCTITTTSRNMPRMTDCQ